jgi:Domain of unknown function (DUF5615)
MNLYLDDDSTGALLVRLLRAAGHDVLIPADIGRAGAKDPVHQTESARRGRVLLTRNHDDFKVLHELILLVGGHHPGTFIVRKDNDKKRDMKPHDIVRAIGNLLGAGVPIADGFHILNFYR